MRCLVGVLASGAALFLSGCAGSTPHATHPSATMSNSSSPTAPPATTPIPAPTLVVGGSAAQNKAFFDVVNRRTVRAHRDPVGSDFIDALARAGFAKKDMQVTADKTSVGLTPGSVQFSVRWDGDCLIGQYGADIGGYHSEITPVLQTGKCLIGQTAPIR
jgi:hypothetical protein